MFHVNCNPIPTTNLRGGSVMPFQTSLKRSSVNRVITPKSVPLYHFFNAISVFDIPGAWSQSSDKRFHELLFSGYRILV